MNDRDPDDGLAIRPLAESGLLVVLGEAVDAALVARVGALTAALDAAKLPGVVDVVPSYATVMIAFDPTVAEPFHLSAMIRRLAVDAASAPGVLGRVVELPVCYGGEHGPDLEHVARRAGLPPDEVVARHAAGNYAVACMGFAPGFGFLVGLPPELATPRRTDPRTRVPPGSVGIGGVQTGVYSLETPGGWHLIGRTPLRLFDLDRAEPSRLRPGDRVVFRHISATEYLDIEASHRQARDDRPAPPRASLPDVRGSGPRADG